jgi:hypothetical protein
VGDHHPSHGVLLGGFEGCHCEALGPQLLVVELSLFLGTTPHDRSSLGVDLMGQLPGLVRLHPWDVTNEALNNMLEGVHIIVEHDNFVAGIRLMNALALLNGGG